MIEAIREGLRQKDRRSLAKAITYVENQGELQTLIRDLPERFSYRIGISGPPGVGKSTFIENFGLHLANQGLTVCVLTIDPSSQISGGSILGDKTRMPGLSQHPKAFIRPSPSSGALGGIHPATALTLRLCETFGFDYILIETVGVGQSESEIADLSDFLLLLSQPGSGDDLQGIKRGILEMAQGIFINKQDLLPEQTMQLKAQLASVLDLLQKKISPGLLCSGSALSGLGIPELFQHIQTFLGSLPSSMESKRKEQEMLFFRRFWQRQLIDWVKQKESDLLGSLEEAILSGNLSPQQAVEKLKSTLRG